MKRRLLILYSGLLITLVSSVIVFVSQGSGLLAGAFILLSVGISGVILSSWMNYVTGLIRQSNHILNKQDAARTWQFSNLEVLAQNQDQVARKIHTSAELISNLAHPEKMDALQSLDHNDPIGNALHAIREEMQKIKQEDEKRAWITQGLALFSEILRNKAELREYGHHIISNLVKYVQANQGGLYIEYQDTSHERYLELTACYAYGKRKYTENRIVEGEGILGQCMLEKEIVFITDVPKSYIKITSGLGEAVPRSIIVLPLLFNDTFCGVIELASFQVLKPHQIEFLKKVCENIASEIASLKNMEHTKALLEESNTLTQELQSREEEMRQNMEELAATQEEMSRKQMELTGVINAIDSTLATAEFDRSGKLIRHNNILEQFFGASYLKSRDYTLITGNESVYWGDILNGEIRSGEYKTKTATGSDLWLSVTFTPIKDANDKPEKLMCLIQDVTERKIKENEFERLSIVANNTDNSVIITDGNGYTEYVNAGFTRMTGYEASDIYGQKPGSVLQGPLTDKKTIEKLSEHIAQGVSVYEEILNYNKKGESYWVSLAINPVKDAVGNIIRYISIQSDITQTKIRAMDFHQKMEALSRSNAIIEIDKNGNLADINNNYLEILGYQKEELIGKPYSFLSRKDEVFTKMVETIREKGVQNGVFSRYDKNGNKHYMKLMDYPVLNLNGEIEKIIEFGVDVSNEKRLEKEAERRQSELRSYLSGINNTIASAEFTLDGRFVTANEIFHKVMAFSQQELAGTTFDFLMGDDQAIIMMWENLRLGKFFSGEFKMKNKAGKELWLTGTFNPITIEGDVPEKIMMFAQFTTQEKEKVNDLNGTVQALKSTLPVIELNPDFVCKTANEKALKLFGLSRIEVRSKSMMDFIAHQYYTPWNHVKNEILNTDFTTLTIPFQVGPDIVNYAVSISVIRNLEGNVSKLILLLVHEIKDSVPAFSTL